MLPFLSAQRWLRFSASSFRRTCAPAVLGLIWTAAAGEPAAWSSISAVPSGGPPAAAGGWGVNDAGQLLAPTNLLCFQSIYAGRQHVLGLACDGSVAAWGDNQHGQCDIPAALTNAIALTAGAQHSVALTAEAKVVAWGDNAAGQCTVPAGLQDVVAIAAGGFHSLALTRQGTVVGWGNNLYGQALGPSGLPDPVALAAGAFFSAVLLEDGRVLAWGYNGAGQTAVPESVTNAIALAAGANHCVALLADGTVAAWGHNGAGQTDVPPDLAEVVAVAAGFDHSLALRADGSVVGWGGNGSGQSDPPAGLTNLVAVAAGDAFNIGLSPAPVIRRQPASRLLVLDAPATFAVEAVSGSEVNYQWLRNGVPIAGAIRPEFTLTNVELADAGRYAVVVSNLWGVTVSVPADLSPAPVIQSSPASRIVQVGGNATFTVTVESVAPPVYQWLFNGVEIPGASAATFERVQVQPAEVGEYRVRLSSSVGTVTSPPAWLSLVSSNQPARIGGDISLSFTSSLALPLQWQVDGRDLAGATNTSLVLTNVQPSDSGHYRVRAESSGETWVSPDVVVTVFLPPSIVDPPVSQAVLVGEPVTLSVGAGGTSPLHYQWWFEGARLPGATGPAFSLAHCSPAAAGLYQVVVTNFAGAVTSAPVMLEVHQPPAIVDFPVSRTLPAGSDTTLTATVSGTAPLEFQWHHEDAPVPGATNATLLLADVQAATAGGYRVVVGNRYGTATSSVATLTVTAAVPVFTVVPRTRIGWTGGTLTLEAAARGSEPMGYQWTRDGVVLAAAADGPLVLSDLEVADAGRYVVTASNALGTAVSGPATVRVVAVPAPGEVVTWGGSYGMSGYVPADVCGAVAVAGATSHSLALVSDGTLRAWGKNDFGQLQVPAGLADVVAIDGGNFHSIVLRADGTVVAWANNGSGQSTVPAGLKPAIAVSAGGDHNVVLQEDGTVAAWGLNYSGECNVPAGLSNVVEVAAGSAFSLALRADGTVVGWGRNDYGQLAVPIGLSNVVALAAGRQHALALRQDGTVAAWGDNTEGACSVPPGLTGVVAITAGGLYSSGNQSIARRADGTLVGWGRASWGALNFPAELGPVTAVVSGAGHVLALKPGLRSSTISVPPASMTTNAGATVGFSAAVSLEPLSYQWQFNGGHLPGATGPGLVLTNVQVAASGEYALVVTSCAGAVTSAPAILTVLSASPVIINPVQRKSRVAGESARFRVAALGSEPLEYRWFFNGAPIPAATNAVLVLANLEEADAGPYEVLVSNDAGAASATYWLEVRPPVPFGTVVAWGDPRNLAPAGNSGISAISAGRTFSLALRTNGTMLAWGDNGLGQTSFPAGLTDVIRIAAGGRHGLALRADGTVVGWGHNYNGQATPPAGLDDVESVAAGDAFSVVARADGSVVAWGNGFAGVLSIPASATNVAQVAAGSQHVIALRHDGTVTGWGDNNFGQVSGPAAESNVVAIAAGHVNTAVLKADGTVRAFGINFAGQNTVPAGLSNVVAMAIAYGRLHVATSDGAVIGWGENDWGQLNPPLAATNVVAVAAGDEHALALRHTGLWISRQPEDLTLALGANANWSVEAAGVPPLSYQWTHDGTLLPGATGPELSLWDVRESAAGVYQAIIRSPIGESASAPARLTVLSPPRLVFEPESRAVPAGSSVTLWAQAKGSLPLSFQWQMNGTNLAGQTATNLVLSNLDTLVTNVYQVRVTNAYGAITSLPARITVLVPPSVVAQPGDQVAVVTSNATFSVLASGTPPFSYQWQFNAADLPGATGATLELSDVPFAAAGSYRVVVTSPFGTATSLAGTLTVLPLAPTLLAPPANRTVPVGGESVFSVIATGAEPLTYRWRQEGVVLSGATEPTLALAGVQGSAAGWYDVVVANAFGSVTSAPAMLRVTPNPNVVAWGVNDRGQTDVPASMTNIVSVAASVNHVLALRADGTVSGWGANYYGVLDIPAGLSNVVAVAAGNNHSVALREDGTVACWGNNTHGQVTPPANLSNVVAITAGSLHTLALKQDGRMAGWGYNAYRQATPSLFLTNIIAVAAGLNYSLALRGSGIVYGWGGDFWNPTGISNVVALAGASFSFLLLQNDGRVLDFGSNATNGPTDAIAISAGSHSINAWPHHLAIRRDHTLVAWGADTHGQSSPPPGLSNVTAIAAGYYFSVAALGGAQFLTQPASQTGVEGDSVSFHTEVYSFVPTTFQWERDGMNIPGATNAALSLAAIQYADRGNYTLLASNHLGITRSAPAVLTVIPFAPAFAVMPANQAVAMGETAVFTATVLGVGRLAYQWRFNGADLPGATADTLTLPNVSAGHGGVYTLFASNASGAVESAPATLIVFVPDLILDNSEAGFSGTWDLSQAGTNRFGPDFGAKPQGSGASRASFVPAVPLAGVYQVYEWHPEFLDGSAAVPHFIEYDGGTQLTFVDQQVNGGRWNLLATVPLAAGTAGRVLISDGIPEVGQYAVADAVKFVHVPPPVILLPLQGGWAMVGDSAELRVGASSLSAVTYEWEKDGRILPGANADRLQWGDIQLADDGVYRVIVRNAGGSATSTTVLRVAMALTLTGPAGQRTLSWAGPFVLQCAPEVTGPYDDVPAAASPWELPLLDEPQQFFRLRPLADFEPAR